MWKKSIAGLAIVALIAAGGYTIMSRGTAQPEATATPVPVSASELLTAEARVVPQRSAALSFPIDGTIAEILVDEGQVVTAGQPLARLDASQQRARYDAAQAALLEAQESYELLKSGATEYEISAAEAQLRQAEAQLRQVEAGVNADDLRAAEAQLEQARALLTRLQAGPNSAERRAAEAQLSQSTAALEQARAQLSASKTSAELQLRQAAEALIQAQTTYSTAKWNWEEVDRTGNDPVSPTTPDPTAPSKRVPNRLNDAQKQLYKDAFVRAEAQLRAAEEAVQQAQAGYDAARQAEIEGLRALEQQVAGAQANLDRLLAGADRDQIAAARAQLAAAQAGITRLQGDARISAIDAARASVDAARANMDRVRAGTPERELAVARARINTAEADLELATVGLADTELRAPFAGVVATIDLHAHEHVTPGAIAMRLADLTAWKIETTDLTELNVAVVREGAPVTITADALPDLQLSGRITHIQIFGESRQGDITYEVLVTPDRYEPQLRWNMTVAITVQAG